MKDPTENGSGSADVRLYSAASTSLRSSIAVGWARALLGAIAVLVIGSILDRLVAGQPVTPHLAWLIAILVARALLAASAPIFSTQTSTRVESDLRRRIIDAALRLGPQSGLRTGETVGKATEGVEAVGALAGTFLPQLIAGISIPLLLGIVVATVDWPTAVVLVLVLPIVPLLLRLLEKRFASVSARYRATADQLAARFLDGIQGLRTLKTLDRADSYGDEIATEAETLRSETMGLLRVNQLALLAVDTLFTLGTVVAAAVMAAIRLSAGAITVGEAVAVVLLGVMLIEPLSQIGRFFYVGAIGRAAAAQVKELLTSVPPPADQALEVEVPAGSICFEQVGFEYPDGTRALTSIDFEIRPGETVALVGPSGSGKTTIAHLVLGLLEPTHGSISVVGEAVMVPQRPFLFHGSVADNLLIARPDAGEDELWSALEAAELSKLFSERGNGLQTEVGERGLQLSAGEVQRLAIARALLVDAPIVVLDEPTSNVDLESEARLRVAIEHLTRDRTLLLIAHRRSTVSGVGRALVIDSGTLINDVPGREVGDIFNVTQAGGPS
ncbi:MAG: ATP-binding cassette domain-containing protein [Actinobacteria bacterium]|nr:MAG: ATP-binding cassette domain-containing protein [Actinomycetota bacterium]